MKYAFSTLGCPDWSWEDVIATAKDFGYTGVELRGIGRELYLPNIKQFQKGNIPKTVEQLKKIKLELSCLSSDSRMNERFRIDDHLKCAREYIDVAGAASVPYVRVLADAPPAPAGNVDIPAIAGDLQGLAEYAKAKDVTVLIETNGVFANSDTMLQLISMVDHENIAILWDIHHPFRFFHEPVAYTYGRLKEYIRYIHVKDSLMSGNTVSYQMMGHGDVPVREALDLLEADGFRGYVSLEWLKRWCTSLTEPGIVFPHFLSYVRK